MRIAEVIGRVTLSRFNPQLRGGRFLIALPMPLAALTEGSPERGEEVVVYDILGAGRRQPDRPQRGPRGRQPVRQDQDPGRRLLRVPDRPIGILARDKSDIPKSNAQEDREEIMSGNGAVMNEWKLREQMCEIGRRVYNKGFAAANDGNISYRLGEDRVLCTPTRVSKGFMKPDDLCIVDLDGKQVSGKRKRSSEILLHLTIMKARADVRSVVHCHPPHATAFAVAREPIPKCILPEFEVFLGEVAISPYETPGAQSFADTVLPFVKDTDTILLANHGTVTYGSDLEDAYFKTEIIDAYCRILILAKQLGRVQLLHRREGGRADQAQAEAGHPRPSPGAGPRELRPLRQQPVPRRLRRAQPRASRLHPPQDRRTACRDASPIESCLTPLAADMHAAESGRDTASHGVLVGQAVEPTVRRSPAADRPGGPRPGDHRPGDAGVERSSQISGAMIQRAEIREIDS